MNSAGLMILFTMLVLIEFGCQTKSPENFLTVTTDPSELEKARKTAGGIAEILPEKKKNELFAEFNPVSPYIIYKDLAKCGILKGIDPGNFMECFKKTYPKDYPTGSKNEPDLLGLPRNAGILLRFDVETDRIPVRHDRLILDFSGISSGTFQPEACNELLLQKNPDDYESRYEVQFIWAGKLHRFTEMNFCDWDNLERVIFACRKAVVDSGKKRTFYQVATGDQTAPDAVGFDKIIIRSRIIDDLQWGKCGHNSLHGTISSSWHKKVGSIFFKIQIPVSSEAMVYLPSLINNQIYKNGKQLEDSESSQFLEKEKHSLIYGVGSGSYLFEIRRK